MLVEAFNQTIAAALTWSSHIDSLWLIHAAGKNLGVEEHFPGQSIYKQAALQQANKIEDNFSTLSLLLGVIY